MLKIRALNRESSSDEDFPVIRREAQEEIALEEYNKALKLQSEGNLAEAKQILLNLISDNIPQLENNGGLPHSMSTIKYSCHLNIGNICLKDGQASEALDNYLNASELDPTDVSLWYKIGTLAIKQNRFRQAAYALVKGLDCSESHWPCLDQLISLLYAMRETVSCLWYIGKALILDPDYLKGLVIRKEIYRNNPATRDYYKLYNPDYIWEPSLDVDIDESDEKAVLEQEQLLFDQITDAEKLVGPKPLQTIPLPKALDDFTWVSFGKVVTELHQYLTDHKMTHFTMVDLTKCMSQQEKEQVLEEVADFDFQEKKVEDVPAEKNVETETKTSDEEKMEAEPIMERRPSQNSDTKDDGQENTPIQTDIDEEPAMDQDGEEQEESTDNKTDKNRSRGSKRKRDLLSDLQIWGWHSKRKHAKKGKGDKDFKVEDALNRIIPKSLLKSKIGEDKFNQSEDSMNTMDVYNMYVENRHVNILSPIHSPKGISLEEYFGTEQEKNDVLAVWTMKREYCDAIVLVKEFVMLISKRWHIKWPKELIQLYVDAYDMYREHYDIPDVFCGDFSFAEMRDDALATLLYGELLSFSPVKCETRTIHPTLLGFVQNISGWQDEWQEEFPSFFIRVYWLRTHIFRKEGNNDLAIRALELISEVMHDEENKTQSPYVLSLPNCHKCGLITDDIVSKIFKHLDMITSLNCVEALFKSEKYKDVAEVLKLTFTISGSHPTAGKMGRPAQLAMLLHSLWFTDLIDCFVWTEECLYEALYYYLRPVRDSKWEKIVEKCLAFFYEIIKMETVVIVDALSADKRARLVETLAKIVCKQLNDNTSKIPLGCITPWILLYYVLVREEHRQQACKKVSHVKTDKLEFHNEYVPNPNEELPPSIAILFSAHEFLGPKGWCLTGGGQLLHFMLDSILDRLDTPIFDTLREKIDIHIEQAMFCLYQHPSKKNKISRHLADHNVDPLSLTWERAFQLYEFYGPDYLPEFNSYKNASITSDLEQLLQRITALVPNEIDPQLQIPKIYDFIQGKTDELPEPINFPNKVRAIYYLIGDYYFKQREFNRCVKYFVMDLSINPHRLDSWACIGLSYLSQLENKLNYCKKLKSEMEFLDKAKGAQISFRKALELEKDHIMLWIEFGSFEYMVHSFCSRVMKTESDTLSMEKFEYLESQKNSYLESSGLSFERAIQLYQPDECDTDERWLQYYILGKVAEKKQKEPSEYLQYYVTASKLLHENNAMYPDKINYHNPQHLSVEALELHYRMNASILKYLELHEGKEITNVCGNSFKHFLDSSVFPKKATAKQSYSSVPQQSLDVPKTNSAANEQKETDTTVPDPSSETLKNEQISKDVELCLGDMLSKVDDVVKERTERVITEKASDKTEKSSTETEKAPAGADISISSDVIMISDSEDEQTKIHPEEIKIIPPSTEGKDVQELLDKMMAETMKKTEEQSELDSDTSVNSKNVFEVKPEEKPIKPEKKLKSGSETDDIRTSVDESSSSPSSSSNSSSSSESDSDEDTSSSSSSSSSEATTGNMTNNDISTLIDRCIAGLEQCIIRLPQNYKAIYRLAHFYFNYKAKRDFAKCKQLLLGEYLCKSGAVINGLFSDRKNHNFFNGIWRIPSSEIDRPGSLSAHMSRCITLLLQILRATNDNKVLLDLSIQFRRTPDPDKIYIKDSERMQFADQAMTMCIQSLRSQIQNIPNLSITAIQKLLNDIYRSYQLIQKHDPSKESTFASLLMDAYKKWKKDKIPENSNVLDLATKFCQQNRIIEKQKQQQLQTQTAVMRAPGAVTNPPVLPSPSTLGPSNQPPLKRPGMGRPRGRPPLPKIPGQTKASSSRGSNMASKFYAWQKSMLDQNALNYLKHYQKELLKQYSQSLNFTQQMQPNLSNTYAGQFTNHLLARQNSLLNDPAYVKQLVNSMQLLSSQGNAPTFPPQPGGPPAAPLPEAYSGLTINPISPPDMSPKSLLGKSSTYSKKSHSAHSSTITSSSQNPQNTTITKVKTSTPSTVYGMNLSQLGASNSKTRRPYGSKQDKNLLSHSIASLTQSVPTSSKIKTMYTQDSMYPASLSYSNPDLAKIGKALSAAVAATKTTSSLQFKEPAPSKAHQSSQKVNENAANILMKERPNISITPVMPHITTAAFTQPVQTSPTKTLQEKLADKQKHSAKHLGRNIEAEVLNVDSIQKSLNLPSIPSCLSVSKATNAPKFPTEAGISISQIPVTQPHKMMEVVNQMKERTLQQIRPTPVMPPKVTMPSNTNKKEDNRRFSSDDDVVIID